MSSIERLAISGIRSFSPDEEQEIRFKKPITLICGPNGTGKSTVIECLKYATTGILPPGCGNKSGQAFIFDTELAKYSEVKATIKLLFRNRTRAHSLVQRHFKLTQRGKKKEFKALDGALKMKDPRSGETISQSTRGTDLDRLVPELLGVSPAILDNVIFCHQEENNWPLRESAELKKKFDDIFESTRYTKALAELKKARKEVADQAKDAKRDSEITSTHLTRANNLRSELEETTTLLEAHQADIAKLDVELALHNKNLDTIKQRLRQFEGKYARIGEMSGQISERERMLEREKNEGDFDAKFQHMSLEELRDAHIKLNAEFDKSSKAVKDLQYARGEAEHEKVRLQTKIDALSTERADLNARMEESARQMKKHESLAMEARGKYPKFFRSDRASPADVREAMNEVVKVKKEQLAKAEHNQRTKYEQDSKLIEDIRGQSTALGHQSQLLMAEHKRMDDAHEDVSRKLASLGEDSAESERLLREAKARSNELSKRMQTMRNDNPADKKKTAIQEAEKQISELDARKAKLEIGIAKLEQQQEYLVRLQSKRTDIAAKAGTVSTRFHSVQASLFKLVENGNEDLKTQAKSSFDQTIGSCQGLKAYWMKASGASDVLVSPTKKSRMDPSASTASANTVPEESSSQIPRVAFKKISEHVTAVHEVVRSVAGERKNQLDTAKQNRDELMERHMVTIGQLKQTRNDIANQSKIKSELEESLPKSGYFDVLDGVERKDGETREKAALRSLEDALEAAKAERGLQAHTKDLYRLFIKQSLQHHTCGLCGQECKDVAARADKPIEFKVSSKVTLKFDAGKDYFGAEGFQLRLIQKCDTDTMRDREKAFAEKVRLCEEKLEGFRKHLPTVQRLEDVEQSLVRLHESECEQENKKEEFSRTIQKLESQVQGLEMPLREAERIEKELSEILRISKEAERMEEDADREEKIMDGPRLGGDMEGIHSLAQARNKREQLSKEKDSLYERIRDDTKFLQNVQAEMEQAMNNLTDAQKAVARLEKEASERLELTKERKRISDQIANLVQQIEGIRARTSPLDKQCEDLEDSRKRASEMAKKEIERLRLELDVAVSDQKTLESAREAGESALRSGVRARFDEVDDELKKQRARLAELQENQAKADSAKDDAENKFRLLEIYRKKLLNTLHYAQNVKELEDLKAQKAALEREVRGDASGASDLKQESSNVEKLVTSIAMQREKFVGGMEAYQKRVNQIKVQLMEPQLKDADKRHADQLVVLVTRQMAAKDLEKYSKALDMALMKYHADMVEEVNKRIRELWHLTYRGGDIDKVELKAEQGTGVGAHTYTYRVIMQKNGTELDMRGRCSAGQKVLASLVIRLALADTFSTKCGVLALDEPSTNLDLDNKKGLAEALAEIIKSRANQSNFQLIVITHDDEFVDIIQTQLGSTGAPFYRIYREQDQSGKYVSRIKEESAGLV